MQLVPPSFVGGHDHALVRRPLFDDVRASAVGVGRGESNFFGLVVLNFFRLVLNGPRLAHDEEGGEVVEHGGVGLVQNHIQRVIVHLFHFFHAGHINLHGALWLANAVERKHHVVGSEVRTIVELHVLAQIESHSGGVHVRPTGGQRGLNFVILVVAHQSLVGVTHNVVGGSVVLGVGVKRQNVILSGPFEFDGLGAVCA